MKKREMKSGRDALSWNPRGRCSWNGSRRARRQASYTLVQEKELCKGRERTEEKDWRRRCAHVKTCGAPGHLPSRLEKSIPKSPSLLMAKRGPQTYKRLSPGRLQTQSLWAGRPKRPFGYGLPWYVKNLSTQIVGKHFRRKMEFINRKYLRRIVLPHPAPFFFSFISFPWQRTSLTRFFHPRWQLGSLSLAWKKWEMALGRMLLPVSLTSKHECQFPALREKQTQEGNCLPNRIHAALCVATIQAHRPGSESTNHCLPQVWLSELSGKGHGVCLVSSIGFTPDKTSVGLSPAPSDDVGQSLVITRCPLMVAHLGIKMWLLGDIDQ